MDIGPTPVHMNHYSFCMIFFDERGHLPMVKLFKLVSSHPL